MSKKDPRSSKNHFRNRLRTIRNSTRYKKRTLPVWNYVDFVLYVNSD